MRVVALNFHPIVLWDLAACLCNSLRSGFRFSKSQVETRCGESLRRTCQPYKRSSPGSIESINETARRGHPDSSFTCSALASPVYVLPATASFVVTDPQNLRRH